MKLIMMVVISGFALGGLGDPIRASRADEPVPRTGLTVTVVGDSGGSMLFCNASVSGGTAPYTYAWSPVLNVSLPFSHLPAHPEDVRASCNTAPPNLSEASVTVTDVNGLQGSALCEAHCSWTE